jgi:hypothetical protein
VHPLSDFKRVVLGVEEDSSTPTRETEEQDEEMEEIRTSCKIHASLLDFSNDESLLFTPTEDASSLEDYLMKTFFVL